MITNTIISAEKIQGTYTGKLSIPKIYGHWAIGNFYIAVDKQLTPEQIKNTEDLLGWEWKPYKS